MKGIFKRKSFDFSNFSHIRNVYRAAYTSKITCISKVTTQLFCRLPWSSLLFSILVFIIILLFISLFLNYIILFKLLFTRFLNCFAGWSWSTYVFQKIISRSWLGYWRLTKWPCSSWSERSASSTSQFEYSYSVVSEDNYDVFQIFCSRCWCTTLKFICTT